MQAKGDIAGDVNVREERVILEYHAHFAFFRRREMRIIGDDM